MSRVIVILCLCVVSLAGCKKPQPIAEIPDYVAQLTPQEKFFEAISERDVEAMGEALEEGADLNLADKSNRLPLQTAAMIGNLPMGRLLLQKGAEVNKPNNGLAALHSCLLGFNRSEEEDGFKVEEQLTFLQLLIDNDADVNAVSKREIRPLDMTYNEQAITILRTAGAKSTDEIDAERLQAKIDAAGGGLIQNLPEKITNPNQTETPDGLDEELNDLDPAEVSPPEGE